MKKEFLIDYKGDFNKNKIDDETGLQFVDIVSNQYGQIKLNGTDKDLNQFLKEMERTSPNFKLIGVTDLAFVVAVVNLYESKEVEDSIFSIREHKYFDQENQPIGKATVSSIVQLIKDSGDDESEVIRFLTTDKEFRTWIKKVDLLNYIIKNPLT